MRVAITNHTGARNRGADALITALLAGLREYRDQLGLTSVDLHTSDREYDMWRYGDQMNLISATSTRQPWIHGRNLTINKQIYSLAAIAERLLFSGHAHKQDFNAARSSDLIICSGGDNLSADYGSFYAHASYMNLGVPAYLCGQSIGPFPGREEAYFRKSLRNVRLVTARESHTFEYMKSLRPDCRLEQTADVAFLLPVLDREDTLAYAERFLNADLSGKKLAALSVSEMITRYYKYGREEGIRQVAAFVDHLNGRGFHAILIPHVMESGRRNNDLYACSDVMRQVKDPRATTLMNGLFNCIEAKSIISLCDILVGARTHTTIASLSRGIPTVAIAYSRKAYGIIEDFYGAAASKRVLVPADEVYTERLIEAADAALDIGPMPEAAARMKALAHRNFALIPEVFTSSTARV